MEANTKTGSTGVFTIIACNYLPFARVLMRSVREFIPEAARVVILADRRGERFDPSLEDFEVITSEDLHLPDSEWFHFKYTRLELCTAVKPYAFEFLFRSHGFTKLVYLDPDIRLYGAPTPFLDELDQHSIVLTPHLTAPLEGPEHPTDLDIMRAGSYNLGFLALRWGDTAEQFLKWWQSRCFDDCVVDLPRGLFVDQKWIDLVPGIFSDVKISRHRGLNVAYWNVGERAVSLRDGHYEVNGQSLVFFHYSGFKVSDPESFSIHQKRFRLSDLPAVRELALAYREELMQAGFKTCAEWPYAYGVFENSEPIPDAGRRIAWADKQVRAQVERPFSDQGFRVCAQFWNSPVCNSAGEATPLSQLAYRIYAGRADLQSAMPNVFGADLRPFLEWLISHGPKGHALTGLYLTPVWDAWKAVRRKERVPPGQSARTAKPATAPSRIAMAIYASRPDLQRWFPDPQGKDAMMFRLWLLTYGRKDHYLTERYIQPLRQEWRISVRALSSPFKRARCHATLLLCQCSVGLRAATRFVLIEVRNRLARKRFRRAMAVPPEPIGEPVPTKAPGGAGRGPSAHLSVAGYLNAPTGVGQAGRMLCRAAEAAGLDVTLLDVTSLPGNGFGPPRGKAGSVNLFCVNADQTPQVLSSVPAAMLGGRVNVGFWNWELEEFPLRFVPAISHLDEIWAPSAFVQDAIVRKSLVPVVRIPVPVEVSEPTPLRHSEIGAGDEEFLFLFAFDMASVFDRKNPLAVIRAFEATCQGNRPCRLILKVSGADSQPAHMRLIRQATAHLPVTILDSQFSRERMTRLIQTADSIVSLHRSEGFGMLLAEAMALGKPVVATGYSGNLEFMNPRVSYLVDYDLVAVPADRPPYDAGRKWAEPHWEQAAEYMRGILRDPGSACAIGRKGREHVQDFLAPSAIGRRLRERIELLVADERNSRRCPDSR